MWLRAATPAGAIANQFSETTPAGLWNSEKLWHLQFPGQAAYILPPVAHMGDGPSGFTHYPGTGFPAAYNDHFFMCDFRGASGVQRRASALRLNRRARVSTWWTITKFCWGVLCTDVEFSPDGQIFVHRLGARLGRNRRWAAFTACISRNWSKARSVFGHKKADRRRDGKTFAG